ncbi:MAG: hypothetical protein LBU76_04585 [Azoarcus sp.]|jgi:hypothetical protein|nr:hypothetical protein [Azoarcus sp.]
MTNKKHLALWLAASLALWGAGGCADGTNSPAPDAGEPTAAGGETNAPNAEFDRTVVLRYHTGEPAPSRKVEILRGDDT